MGGEVEVEIQRTTRRLSSRGAYSRPLVSASIYASLNGIS